jgi:hypothetical protein
MKKVLLLLLSAAASGSGFSQIKAPQTPQFGSFPSANSARSVSITSYPASTANSLYSGDNKQAPSIHRQNQQLIATVTQKRQEVEQIIRELQMSQKKAIPSTTGNRYNPADNAKAIEGFPPALQHLKDMLEGKAALSVADAYYTLESAYGNVYLTREQYNETIKQSVDFIKSWMLQNGLSLKDNYMVHFAIQKFMSEQLTITKTTTAGDKGQKVSTIAHSPFYYDYNDYMGEKDYRNYFLTKCLATGFGQCSSMPALYLVLAEGLGVKAYLSMAPHHSFVKFPDNEGYIVNYEPTSNWQISDKWYKDNLFISARAVATGIYLDTLNSRQVVANCVFDLALAFMSVDRTLNDAFILDCLRTGSPQFPKNNHMESLFIYSVHLKTKLREAMKKQHITNIDEIAKYPEAEAIYKEYLDHEAYITSLGYQDMPAGMYEEMLNEHEFKGRMQQGLNVSGKQPRNLFSKTDH